jgi:glycosyltransferase involved in cell wall biosynthesis
MRIALVRRSCSLRRGGAERYCVDLARELTRLGEEVTIVCHEIDRELRDEFRHIAIATTDTTSWTKNLSFARNVEKALAGQGFDIVYGLSRAFGLDAYRVTDRLQAHWMNVFYRHPANRLLQHLNPRHRAILQLERTICRAPTVHRIVTESNLDRDLVRRYYAVPEAKVKTVHNGVDTAVFNPSCREHRARIREAMGIAPSIPMLVFASMDFERKGLRTVLEALCRAREPVHLLVLGDGNIRHFTRIANDLGIGSRVSFAGRRDQVERYYGAGDMFVLPTIYEPFGLVHLEALACGLPVITTGSSGAAGIIREGWNGYVIPHSLAVGELVSAINHHLGLDGADRDRMSRNAAEFARGMTLQENARNTRAVFEEVLDIKGKLERRFSMDAWDSGRVVVNREYAATLDRNGLTTFDALINVSTDETVRKLPSRETARLALRGAEDDERFYIKRHTSVPLKEYVKPLLRLTWPILGAENEWDAMIRFHRLGIRTMVPVAYGKDGSRSFVLTEAIEGCESLADWADEHLPGLESERLIRALIGELATILRTMHDAGIHHQDFYLCHLLRPRANGSSGLYVVDLGRARQRRRLSRRWIIKDLAQLNYSALAVPDRLRLRFLREYLGRPLRRSDRGLIRALSNKARAIERHTDKHGL